MQMESLVERVRHVVRVVYYMLRKGLVSKRKLMMDLHLLLKRGKLAGKALANLMATMTFHHHGGGAASSSSAAAASFSCASVDRTRDVEFSCTNTPSSSSSSSSFFFRVATNRNRRNRRSRRGDDDLRAYDAAAIAKAFEMLGEDDAAGADWMAAATPSPALTWSGGALWKSPALVAPGPVRQLRITDSPFPVAEEEGSGSGERVDVAAEEFIRRFYEQLRMQRSAAATPDYYRQ